jgi:hypothetical protein
MNHFTIAQSDTTLQEATQQVLNLSAYVSSLRSLNLSHLASVYGFDEADQAKSSKEMTDVFGMFKEAFPEIATFTTAHMNAGVDGIPEQNATKVRQHFRPFSGPFFGSSLLVCFLSPTDLSHIALS